MAKQLTDKRSSSSQLPTLIEGDIEASTDIEKSELLNKYFCKQSTIDDSNHNLPEEPPIPTFTLSAIDISPLDVLDAIKLIDPTKACGPDLVSPRLLREAAQELSTPLAIFFTRLIHSSYYPDAWKFANVVPIYKKSDPSNPQNYRPISLLSCVGKLMERCIHKFVYNFAIENSVLTALQSGFIKGDSTINQLTYLYNDISKALDNGLEVRAVFCDISKAFDRVWHRGLIYKLSSIGINGCLLQWFKSYLMSRKQRVVHANASSTWEPVKAGVPQGSILGPLLFLIYINDIVNDIKSKIRLFADDTSLYIIVDDPLSSSISLNDDLQTIHTWSKRWLVSFNPSKTETMIFSRKCNKPVHPNLIMNDVVLDPVKEHKHLGLTFSNDAKWSTHITLSLNKAWKSIGILRSLKFILKRSCLERLYLCYIRPLLEYGDIIWDNCSKELKDELEAVQNEAGRIVTGVNQTVWPR